MPDHITVNVAQITAVIAVIGALVGAGLPAGVTDADLELHRNILRQAFKPARPTWTVDPADALLAALDRAARLRPGDAADRP